MVGRLPRALPLGLALLATPFALAGIVTHPAPSIHDTAICGSVGGRWVDVSGCSDPLYEVNDALAPPPPPGAPPPEYVPPPPPRPNVNVCANVGRRISVSGCI